MVVTRIAATLVMLVSLTACGRSSTTMTAVPPPRSWAADLADERASRDVSFRTASDSPLPVSARAGFRGLDYYPVDPSWRYAGWVTPYPSPERLQIVTTAGQMRPAERFGFVTFTRDGHTLTLQVYRLLDQPERPGGEGLFLPFKDTTSGKETYAAGRYVDLEGGAGGPFTLDFNRAYNPSCAYGEPERFRCPVTPAENALPVAVLAGERGPAKVSEGTSR
jgi:uncharacterized protein (DUF1684 family)